MKRGKAEIIDWILRIGIFGEFLGHGIFALQGKESFIAMITNVLGVSNPAATSLLLVIGTMDVIVAILALVYPLRIMLAWAALWGFVTGLARPLAGEPVWDFVERWANWALPLALLYIRGIPTKLKEWFS
ncbi:MAG TPA: hypothetical protein VJB94_00760 [Candidatus Nanoarchaeia archaeon]|nr:hypothetical protein [Candidatus Nanoarchaeia archaeon]